jgi:hypothetical protein
MKTRVGIYGDSFACRAWNGGSGLSWPEILVRNHPEYNIQNFAEAGSSLFFSYNKFLKSYKTFDKIIFITTSPGRFSIPDSANINSPWVSRHVVPVSLKADYDGMDYLIGKSIDEKTKQQFIHHKRILHAVEDYFTYLYDDGQDVHNNIGLVNNLLVMHPDILIIPTVTNPAAVDFGLSDPGNNTDKYPSVLTDICKKEITVTGNDFFEVAKVGRDKRHCHMSETNNTIFANKIANYLKTGEFTLNLDDFVYDKTLDVTKIFSAEHK